MLEVSRLRVLAKVVETGSVSAAAEQLFHTPSAVSQQIRKLEEEVGQPLLRRHARGMIPTDAGHTLVRHARAILRQLDAAQSDLDRLASLDGGSVSIGTFPTAGSSFLPFVISRFRRENPSVALDVRSHRLDTLIDLLSRGEVSLSLLWEYDGDPLPDLGFALSPVFEEPTVLMVGADHPLASRDEVAMTELAREPWIIRANEHPVADLLQRACNAAGFSPDISFQANDYQEAQAMVSVGLGIALAPSSAVVHPHPGIRILELSGDVPSRRVVLAQRHDRVRAPAELAFQALVLEMGASWPPRA